jgi:hypothetical protein
LVISSSISGDKDFREFGELPDIGINNWTSIQMTQLLQNTGEYLLTLYIKDEIVFQTVNTDAREFNNVTIFGGDNFRFPSDALIHNLEIETFDSGVLLERNFLMKEIPVQYKEYELTFNIKPLGVKRGWSNILKVGLPGDPERYGDRNPSVWFYSNSTKILVTAAINGHKNYGNYS